MPLWPQGSLTGQLPLQACPRMSFWMTFTVSFGRSLTDSLQKRKYVYAGIHQTFCYNPTQLQHASETGRVLLGIPAIAGSGTGWSAWFGGTACKLLDGPSAPVIVSSLQHGRWPTPFYPLSSHFLFLKALPQTWSLRRHKTTFSWTKYRSYERDHEDVPLFCFETRKTSQ